MKKVAIIGLGIIGGSTGLALRQAKGDWWVIGYSWPAETLTQAVQNGFVDEAAPSAAAAARAAELVVIATPVGAIPGVMRDIARHVPAGTVVMDTGSTKAQVMAWSREIMPSVQFVGGHPMTGRSRGVPGAAHVELFRGCSYVLISTNREVPEIVMRMVKALGAEPLFLPAEEHDRLVAGVSSLPAVLSYVLVAATTSHPAWPRMGPIAAGAYRNVSAVAGGNPRMVADAWGTNTANIIYWLDRYSEELQHFRQVLQQSAPELEATLQRIRQAWETWIKDFGP